MKPIEAIYDPNDTWKPVEEGAYPAHITGLNHKEVDTRSGPAIVVNMTFKIAEQAGHLSQNLWKMNGFNYVRDEENNRVPAINGDGEQLTAPCTHMVGKTYYDNGWFIFTESQSGGKNEKYFGLLETLGVKVEEITVNDKSVKKLVLIEEGDVVGKPVIVTLNKHEFITSETKNLPSEQQEKRTTFKVKALQMWKDGPEISADELEEDIPF